MPEHHERQITPLETLGEQVKQPAPEKREAVLGEPRQDLEEIYRSLLQRIWRIGAAGIGATGTEEIPLEANPFLEATARSFGPEEFFVDEAPLSALFEPRPLRGTISDIMVQVTLQVRELLEHREGLISYYEGVIAATLDHLARTEVGTPENHVDLVLLPLTSNKFRPHRCSGSLQRFAADLRGYLMTQPVEQRGSGWIVTFGILAEFVRHAQDLSCLLQSSVFFHELMLILLAKLRAGELRTEDDLDRIRGVAGNLANMLEGIRRLKSASETEPRLLSARQSLKKITASIVFLSHPTTQGDERVETRALGALFGEGLVPEWWPAVIDDMMGSTTAWYTPDNPLRLLMLECAAAVVRIAGGKQVANAPSAFFNAGISVSKLRSVVDVGKETLEGVRALLNAVGLYWAIRSSPDPRTVLVTNDGLDCCVNMFSACTAIPWQPQQLDILRQLVESVFAFRGVVAAEGEFFQMRTSLNELGISLPEVVERPSLERLFVTAHQTLGVIGARVGIATDLPMQDGDSEPLASVQLVGSAILLLAGEEGYRSACRDVASLLAAIEELAAAPMASIPSLYETFLDDGPVVASGLVERGDWQEAVRQSIVEPPSSLAAVLRSGRALRWMEET